MRWDVIKKAWEMAREQFPSVRRLRVATPMVFARAGEVPILDLDSPGEPRGIIRYETESVGRKQRIRLALGSKEAEVPLAPARPQTFRVGSRVEPWPSGLDPEMVRGRYGDEHAEKLALFLGEPRGYNLRLAAKPRRRFKENERVRICGMPMPMPGERALPSPHALQYQELGQVVSSARTKAGRFYLVLVDGSSEPQWFPEGAICPNLAGRAPSEA